MHRDYLVRNRYFVPFFVFYTASVMLGPRFIHESIFYTQSVMLSPTFYYLSACFVLFSTFPAMQYQICLYYTFSHLRNKKNMRSAQTESLYHKDSNMFPRFNKVKPCSVRVSTWVGDQIQMPRFAIIFFSFLFPSFSKAITAILMWCRFLYLSTFCSILVVMSVFYVHLFQIHHRT